MKPYYELLKTINAVRDVGRPEALTGQIVGLLNQNKHLHLAEVFAVQLLILGVLQSVVCPWSQLQRERQS